MSSKTRITLALCITVISICLCQAARVTYNNYRLYKVQLTSDANAEAFGKLRNRDDSLIFIDDDFVAGSDVHVVVAPHKVPEFENDLDERQLNYTLINKNLKTLLDASDQQVELSSTVGYTFDGTVYNTLNTTYEWLKSLQTHDPNTVALFVAGFSHEATEIFGVEISRMDQNAKGRKTDAVDILGSLDDNRVKIAGVTAFINILQYLLQTKKETPRPAIFIEAGIHGNDWISSATATYIINELLSSANPAIVALTKMYDWFIVPHANPDGYVYSGTTDRLWRKSRSGDGPCFGADLNRNFDADFPRAARSDSICVNNYPGLSAFSEVESGSLQETINLLSKRIGIYIALHGDHEFSIQPAYDHHNGSPTNIEKIDQMIVAANEALSAEYRTNVTDPDPDGTRSLPSSQAGSSVKWVHDKMGIKAAFNIQLGPQANAIPKTGHAKIAIPASEITPIGQQALSAIMALIGKAKALGFLATPSV